ncbi:DUF488 domain-containing protein [Mesorhizobium sp. A623]
MTKHDVAIKRVYEPPTETDGQRVLVDRLWPRGVSKEHAELTLWLKEIAPTTGLRKWFDHDPAKWAEFQKRFRAELDDNAEAVKELRGLVAKGKVTLLYSAHDAVHNNAVVLAEYLQEAR